MFNFVNCGNNNNEVIKMQLTEKEKNLLKDLKGEEELCITKYTEYASRAKDPQLKDLFDSMKKTEQQHYETITQIENGTYTPSSGGCSSPKSNFTATYTGETEDKKNDAFLCTDMLSQEKHVSGVYNTSIFEFKDKNYREALNHIQKEEQQHGEQIYNYMNTNSMYS